MHSNALIQLFCFSNLTYTGPDQHFKKRCPQQASKGEEISMSFLALKGFSPLLLQLGQKALLPFQNRPQVCLTSFTNTRGSARKKANHVNVL